MRQLSGTDSLFLRLERGNEFHVRPIALPQPGDWRQFCIQVARVARAGAAVPGGLTSLLGKQETPTVARLARALRKPPATRLAGKVSAHRVVEVVGLPLAGCKAIRASLPEATLNDLFMCRSAGPTGPPTTATRSAWP